MRLPMLIIRCQRFVSREALSATLLFFVVLMPLSAWALNQSPQAVVGADTEADAGATVTLDGSGSYDPDGDALTYSWQEAGDGNCGLSLAGTDQSTLSFTAPSEETECILKLYVRDGQGGLDSDEVTVFVQTAEISSSTVTKIEVGQEMTGGNGCSLNRGSVFSTISMIFPLFFLFGAVLLAARRNSQGRIADNIKEQRLTKNF